MYSFSCQVVLSLLHNNLIIFSTLGALLHASCSPYAKMEYNLTTVTLTRP